MSLIARLFCVEMIWVSFVECVECLCGVLHITTIHQNINLLNLLSQASFSRTLSVNNMAARLQYSIDYLLFLRDNMALHICPLENFSPNAFLCDLVQLNGRDQNHALERERVLRTTSLRYAPPSRRDSAGRYSPPKPSIPNQHPLQPRIAFDMPAPQPQLFRRETMPANARIPPWRMANSSVNPAFMYGNQPSIPTMTQQFMNLSTSQTGASFRPVVFPRPSTQNHAVGSYPSFYEPVKKIHPVSTASPGREFTYSRRQPVIIDSRRMSDSEDSDSSPQRTPTKAARPRSLQRQLAPPSLDYNSTVTNSEVGPWTMSPKRQPAGY